MMLCRAYSELSTCRVSGMGLGPIPWTAIVKWCEVHDLDAQVAAKVILVIRIVDAETLRRAASKK